MNFHEVIFPALVQRGARKALVTSTDVVEHASGHEDRNVNWSGARLAFEVAVPWDRLDAADTLQTFFRLRRGRAHGFRFRDPSDWRTGDPVTGTDMLLGLGDGARTVFQLIKTYASGLETFARVLSKPRAGTVLVRVDGAEAPHAVDHTTGEITFDTPPAAGARITAGCAFDVPVRFLNDRLELAQRSAVQAAYEVSLIEVRDVAPEGPGYALLANTTETERALIAAIAEALAA